MKKFYDIFLVLHNTFLIVEKGALCVLLFSMIFLSFGQVLSRNLFQIGFPWIDNVLRIEVLWVTFIGAALATEYKQHIKIDILANILSSDRSKRIVEVGAQAFATFVAILLFYAAVDYISQMESTTTLIEGIPDWNFSLVIPYAFFVMIVRCPLSLVKVFCPEEKNTNT